MLFSTSRFVLLFALAIAQVSAENKKLRNGTVFTVAEKRETVMYRSKGGHGHREAWHGERIKDDEHVLFPGQYKVKEVVVTDLTNDLQKKRFYRINPLKLTYPLKDQDREKVDTCAEHVFSQRTLEILIDESKSVSEEASASSSAAAASSEAGSQGGARQQASLLLGKSTVADETASQRGKLRKFSEHWKLVLAEIRAVNARRETGEMITTMIKTLKDQKNAETGISQDASMILTGVTDNSRKLDMEATAADSLQLSVFGGGRLFKHSEEDSSSSSESSSDSWAAYWAWRDSVKFNSSPKEPNQPWEPKTQSWDGPTESHKHRVPMDLNAGTHKNTRKVADGLGRSTN